VAGWVTGLHVEGCLLGWLAVSFMLLAHCDQQYSELLTLRLGASACVCVCVCDSKASAKVQYSVCRHCLRLMT